MGQRKRPSRQRKNLNMDPEQFFTMLTLQLGAPNRKVLDYMSHARYGQGRGPAWWVHETADGRAFMRLVQACGEAKHRAPMWFRLWLKWYEKEDWRDENKLPGHADSACKGKSAKRAGAQAAQRNRVPQPEEHGAVASETQQAREPAKR